jgi:hypothetical protein
LGFRLFVLECLEYVQAGGASCWEHGGGRAGEDRESEERDELRDGQVEADPVVGAVLDTRSEQALEFEVDGSAALDAFNHPYAYAATRRVRSVAPPCVAVTP